MAARSRADRRLRPLCVAMVLCMLLAVVSAQGSGKRSDCINTFEKAWSVFTKWIGTRVESDGVTFEEQLSAGLACVDDDDLTLLQRKASDMLPLIVYNDSLVEERHKGGIQMIEKEGNARQSGDSRECYCQELSLATIDASTLAAAAEDEGSKIPMAVVLYAPHKTGSSVLNKFLRTVSEKCGVCHIADTFKDLKCMDDLCVLREQGRGGRVYSTKNEGKDFTEAPWGSCRGFALREVEKASDWLVKWGVQKPMTTGQHRIYDSFLWGPIRNLTDIPITDGFPIKAFIYHQRHPLDMLVSEYHSLKSRDKVKQSIDEFVLEVLPIVRERYMAMFAAQKQVSPSDIYVSRYEDLFANFAKWLRRMVMLLKPVCKGKLQPVYDELYQELFPSFQIEAHPANSVSLPGRHKVELSPSTVREAYSRESELFQVLRYTTDD